MKINTKKLAILSLLVSVAMILSYVESLFPVFLAVPGVKLGLSNIATVFALYVLGAPCAICVSVVRVCLSALLFGNAVGLIYSLFGAAFALFSMIILKKIRVFSSIGVSVAGGVFHNLGQVVSAAIMMENAGIVSYFVPLLISGTISGVLIGLAAGILVERIEKHIK